jgi:hypothetical protein
MICGVLLAMFFVVETNSPGCLEIADLSANF